MKTISILHAFGCLLLKVIMDFRCLLLLIFFIIRYCFVLFKYLLFKIFKDSFASHLKKGTMLKTWFISSLTLRSFLLGIDISQLGTSR